jgi:type III secretory pathway component EscU
MIYNANCGLVTIPVLFVCNAGLCCDAWTIELVTELAFEATVVLTAQFVVLTVINLGFPDRCFLKPLRFSSDVISPEKAESCVVCNAYYWTSIIQS